MQGIRISILENFGVCTSVIVYYGLAHWSFLLLTRFSKKTRELVDEHYEGIIHSIFENRKLITIDNESSNKLFLPGDLFKFRIYLENEEVEDNFLEWISNIIEKKGLYYKMNYMNHKLWVYNIIINQNFIQKLTHLFYGIKSIIVLLWVINLIIF